MACKNRKLMAGLTIVEVLVAMAITTLLVVAVAVAFNASVTNYQENEDIFKTMNNARGALSRITRDIRTGLVDPNDVASQDRCKLMRDDGSTVTYQYNNAEQKLYLHDHDTDTDYLLCDNVTAMTFIKDNSTETGDVKSVQISMTVSSGGLERTVSAAAVVRRVVG